MPACLLVQVKVGGDNDPLDVCEIGLRQIQTVCTSQTLKAECSSLVSSLEIGPQKLEAQTETRNLGR
jgi:hypothetical protein